MTLHDPLLLIEFRNVGHTYHTFPQRRVQAVDGFTLDIAEGEIVGLAGPNGAGKSTLIALLLGYMRPTTGTVRIDGMTPRGYIERNGIGYLSELIAINPGWKLEEALRRYSRLAGIPGAQIRERCDAVITMLGLAEHRGKRVKQLSKGNLQRLGLAQALLCEERVLILDEPTHGLDPLWTQRFRDLIITLRRPDRAILIASHNLDELQRLADRVAIIDGGRLQRIVDTNTHATNSCTPYRIEMLTGSELVTGVFPDAVSVGNGAFDLPPMDSGALNAGLAQLIAGGALVGSFVPAHSMLEQQFREAVSQ